MEKDSDDKFVIDQTRYTRMDDKLDIPAASGQAGAFSLLAKKSTNSICFLRASVQTGAAFSRRPSTQYLDTHDVIQYR